MCVSSCSNYLPFEVCGFPIRDIHISCIAKQWTLSERCVVRDWDRIMDWLVHEISFFYLNQLFFRKATKAAGQSRLSKFEAVECSKIWLLWPYQLTLPIVYQLTLHGWYDENMDVLAKLMDYMPSKFNTLKSQCYSLYLTIVGLFDVYVVFSQWKSKQVVDYFTLGV